MWQPNSQLELGDASEAAFSISQPEEETVVNPAWGVHTLADLDFDSLLNSEVRKLRTNIKHIVKINLYIGLEIFTFVVYIYFYIFTLFIFTPLLIFSLFLYYIYIFLYFFYYIITFYIFIFIIIFLNIELILKSFCYCVDHSFGK